MVTAGAIANWSMENVAGLAKLVVVVWLLARNDNNKVVCPVMNEWCAL